jgi:hypothetical protein
MTASAHHRLASIALLALVLTLAWLYSNAGRRHLALCNIAEDALANFDQQPLTGYPTVGQTVRLEPVGSKILCGWKFIRFRGAYGGSFLTHFAISGDGNYAVVSGGYQSGELNGAGGICVYQRDGLNWTRLGCSLRWLS